MDAISLFEFYYLSPMLVIGAGIVVLLFLLLTFRVSQKICSTFTLIVLTIALLSTVYVDYQLLSEPLKENIFNQLKDKQQSTPTVETGSEQITETTLIKESNSDDATIIAESDESSVKDAIEVTEKTDNYDDSTELVTSGVFVAEEWAGSYITALFTCDGYGLLYTGLTLFICIVVTLLSNQWFKEDSGEQGLFYLVLLFSALSSSILVYASHLISLFIGIELLSISLVGLIGFQHNQTNSLEAAIKYVILSAVTTTFLLLGIAFYYAATGELTFSGLSFQLSTLTYPSSLLLTGVCLILIGVGFKLSLVPFQLWSPDVYQGAPTAITLLLSTVGKISIFCAVARLFLLAPIVNNETIKLIFILMASCSILWGNFFALMQRSTKRLLAYSSISHFGYLFIALIAVQYQVLALETIGVYLVSYVLASICIFGVISLESHSYDKKDCETEADLRGLFWRRPIMALAMGMGLLSLAGIPLTLGFMGRFLLILLSVTAEFWFLLGVIVIGSTFGLYFYLRLVINLYLRNDDTEDSTVIDSECSAKPVTLSEVIIVCCALLILVLGIYPQPLFTLVTLAQYLTP